MAFLLKRRSDTNANWVSVNPIIPDRQLIFVKDAGGAGIPLIKIGSEGTAFNDLPYINKRNNLEATTSPTTSNNATEFYSVGSMWVNTSSKEMFVLTSFSGSDAVWQPIGELISELQQIQDIPPYPDDGYQYVLTELDGVLSWELPSGGGGGGDVIQSITITTANTTVNLGNGNIIYASAQADSEIDVSNIVVGKKYSFIFSMPAPATRAITFNTDRFYADGGFDPVELTTGFASAKEVVVVECIGLTSTALALRARSDVEGSGVAKLEDVGDVPAYPNDGQEWVLVELDGALTWELKGSGGGGDFIPLTGTEVGSPVTGTVQIASQNCITGLIENTIIGIGDELDLYNEASRLSSIEFTNSSSIAQVYLRAINDTYGQVLRLFEGGSDSYVVISSDNPSFKGLVGASYYGANYTDNTYVQKKYVDDEIAANIGVWGAITGYVENQTDLVEYIEDTPRQYTAGQGTALGTLTIASGSVTPDIAAKNAYSLTIDQNVTINAPSNDRCTSWFIHCTITGAGGWTIGLNSAYKPDGGTALTIPNTTGDKFTLYVQSFGDGTHDITIHTQQ